MFGVGDTTSGVMVIGEGPGADEDEQGKPFVGKSGKLMDQAFIGCGIDREKLYIANIVKCRPPENRNPQKGEVQACIDYLRNQVIIIKPKVVLLLGSVALKAILGDSLSITQARGRIIEQKGIKYIPTYHPAALLRDEIKKIDFWNDLKLFLEEAQKENLNIEL